MGNIKLVLEYDGTDFHGWQIQPRTRTVQGELEKAIGKICGAKTSVIGAGRTDAGVHARGQVANFKTEKIMDVGVWVSAINHYLPDDVAVLSARKVSERFHARYSALGKVYRFRLLNRKIPSPLDRRFMWTFYEKLDLRKMRSAARYFVGHHDFTSFQASNGRRSKTKKDPVCRIRDLKIHKREDEIVFHIEGNRFLQQMVRTMVGTLIEVGRKVYPASSVGEILQKKDRRFAGPTVPPQGLSLEKVIYPALKL